MDFVIIIWVIAAIFIGVAGSNTKFGGIGMFFISLLLTPILGIIILAFSETKESPDGNNKDGWGVEKQETPKEQFKTSAQVATTDLPEQLAKWKRLLDDGAITPDEYQQQKERLLHGKR